jgi:MYXO-CTERM domain-containing protein
MKSPPPRIAGTAGDDAVKDGPCGASHTKGAAAQVEYTAGQQVMIAFDETIDHTGCFQVALATDNATYALLAQKNDPADADIDSRDVGAPRTITATLPAGVTCANCTIQLRQVMLETVPAFPNAQCGAMQDIAQVPAGKVYFQCSDVDIVAAPVPDGGPVSSSSSGAAASSSGAAATSSTSGASAGADGGASGTTPGAGSTDGIGARQNDGDLGDGGCQATPGTTSSAFALLVVAGVALRRRQRSGNKLR